MNLESIIKDLRDIKIGIPLVQKKLSLFRRAYISCFSFAELIQWFKTNINSYLPQTGSKSDDQADDSITSSEENIQRDQVKAKKWIIKVINELITNGVIRCCNEQHVTNAYIVPASEYASTLFVFTKKYRKRVIVIGGGFAGARICKLLEQKKMFNVTLIDTKPYFECLPTIPSLCVNVSNIQKMRANHEKYLKDTEIIVSKVVSIDAGKRNMNYMSSESITAAEPTTKTTTPSPTTATESTLTSSTSSSSTSTTTSSSTSTSTTTSTSSQLLSSSINHQNGIITLENGKKITNFDYLILATGSTYDVSTLNSSESSIRIINGMDISDILKNDEAVKQSKTITVIGGGPVGVEIAGEFMVKCPEKQIHLISSAYTLLERCCNNAHKNVYQFFNSFQNIKIHLGKKVTKIVGNKIFLQDKANHQENYKKDSNNELETDVVFACIGFMPNTQYLKYPTNHSGQQLTLVTDSSTSGSKKTILSQNTTENVPSGQKPEKHDVKQSADVVEINDESTSRPSVTRTGYDLQPNIPLDGGIMLDKKGYVMVNKHLQAIGHDHIFAAGDINNINEEKLAQTAESHADIIVQNICHLERKDSALNSYSPSTRPLFISLGPNYSVFVYGNKVLMEGFLTSMVKRLVEYKIMSQF